MQVEGAMFPTLVAFFLVAGGWVGAAIAAGTAIYGALKGRGQRKMEGQIQGQHNAEVLRESNFDPYAPFRRAAKGVMWGAMMKTWGFDKMFPKEMIDYVSNPANVPGTAKGGFGGAEYLQGMDSIGQYMPKASGKLPGSATGDALVAGIGAAGQFYSQQQQDPFGRESGGGGGGGGS